MAKEVFSDLCVSKCLHVVVGTPDAAAGLVEAEDTDGFGRIALSEFAREVGVEAFGTESDEDVDY